MNLYEIVFTGQLVPGAQRERVEANLAKLFQADAQRIALLFSGRRLVLKNNLDKTAAEKYRSTLERAGALAEMVDMQVEVEEVELAPPPDASTDYRSTHQPDRHVPVVPRDAYMAAFSAVEAPDFSIAEVGSNLQDPKAEPQTPLLDLSQMSLAPLGSDMGQLEKTTLGRAPDTSHLTLS